MLRVKGFNNKIIIEKKRCCEKYIDRDQWKIMQSCILDLTLLLRELRCGWKMTDVLFLLVKRTFVGPSHLASTEDGHSIVIGKECMLSSNINIRTGDSHSIIDLNNGGRINYAKSVVIGDHCWIGEGAKILKGVSLAENCIVGTGSIVTKSYPSNVLISGVPAVIIKEDVNWDRSRIV